MDVVSEPGGPEPGGPEPGGAWVFLDAVNTLIEPVPDVATVYAEVAARHGSRRTAVEIDEEFEAAYAAATTNDRRCDEASERAFWRSVVDRLVDDAADPDAMFKELFERFARSEAWRAFEDVPRNLAKLRAGGYRVAIASNFDARLRPVAAGLPAIADVETLIISTEVGWKKPADEFWQAALTITGADPERSAAVGDSFHEDVRAPRRLGMKGLWLKRGERRRPAAVRTFDEAVERLVAPRPPG